MNGDPCHVVPCYTTPCYTIPDRTGLRRATPYFNWATPCKKVSSDVYLCGVLPGLNLKVDHPEPAKADLPAAAQPAELPSINDHTLHLLLVDQGRIP